MYRVDISDRAEQDLDRIVAYISERLAVPKAAADFVDAVLECFGQLENNPYLYEQCRDTILRKEGYRRAVIKNYIMVYKVNEDAKAVIVHRFFYGRQDYIRSI